jgi:hypothetical protein
MLLAAAAAAAAAAGSSIHPMQEEGGAMCYGATVAIGSGTGTTFIIVLPVSSLTLKTFVKQSFFHTHLLMF